MMEAKVRLQVYDDDLLCAFIPKGESEGGPGLHRLLGDGHTCV